MWRVFAGVPSWFLIVYLKDREKSARAGRRVLGGTMAFVEFADVSKIYQMGEVEVAAVRDMSFTIEQGEFVVIVGPSGAGKTTLLNMLGGMDSATSGTIMLDGARVSSFNRKQLTQYRRHDIGFVFQFYNLVQNLTARENVELASQICRDPLDADEVLAAVGLADRVRNFPGQLSGGEQQRVAIARALAKNPKLLLCDEPTGALDYETGKAILKLLQDTCRDTGRTVVVVTHNSAFTAIADRVIHVREGSVAAVELNETPLSADVLEW
ncbi:ABC transporter ATP-binding component [Adlercreutzia equolifaciens DSM 19450]|nr:ABC transporter ATP-binding component [Adlercreutzia equolifaciens DSM 19450]